MSGLMAGLGIVNLGITAGTTAASFAQAGRLRKEEKKANEAAARALKDARKRLSVNYSDALSIKKEPYKLALERRQVRDNTALGAITEGEERGAAAGVGKVFANSQIEGENERAAMTGEMQRIEGLQVAEDQQLRDANANLDLSEAEGAQVAAAQAKDMAATATGQGIAGITNLGQQAMQMAPLFSKDNEAMKKALAGLYGGENKGSGGTIGDPLAPWDPNGSITGASGVTQQVGGANAAPDFLGMNNKQLKEWMKNNPDKVNTKGFLDAVEGNRGTKRSRFNDPFSLTGGGSPLNGGGSPDLSNLTKEQLLIYWGAK